MKRMLIVVLALLLFAPVLVAGDATKARVALALAVATQPPPVVARDAAGRTLEQAAKAALAEAAAIECDCGVCDAAKSMPASVPMAVAKPACKTVAELLPDYATLRDKVDALKPGESCRVFAGVDVIDDCSFSGTAYKLAGAIPGTAPGVWRCWRTPDGTATMQRLHLAKP